MPSVKVLYIVGSGRSGSTLLDAVLGQLAGFAPVGELRLLWERAYVAPGNCGCGREVTACPVWSRVLAELGGGELTAADVVAWQRDARSRWIPRLLNSASRSEVRGAAAYASMREAAYLATARATDSHVLVDSSKFPPDAALLARMKAVEPYLLHLVRDPRGVAHSWSRPKPAGERGQPRNLPVMAPRAIAVDWLKVNGGAEALRAWSHMPSMRLRYEDFVRDVPASVAAVASFLDEPVSADSGLGREVVRLDTSHTVAGNPDRFTTGDVRVRIDDAWRTDMDLRGLFLVTALTLPLLLRYGYRPWRKTPDGR